MAGDKIGAELVAHRHLIDQPAQVGLLLGEIARELLAAAGAVLMFVAAAMLNPLCLALSPLALLFLVGYSYTKRFTWASHWVLGFSDGIAAAGGWAAVRGRIDPPALVLWFALTVWIGKPKQQTRRELRAKTRAMIVFSIVFGVAITVAYYALYLPILRMAKVI